MTSDRVSSISYVQALRSRHGPCLPPHHFVFVNSGLTVEMSEVSISEKSPSSSHAAEHYHSNTIPVVQVMNDEVGIKGWPMEPQKLKVRTLLSLLSNMCDILVMLAPLAFIMTAVLAAKLDGKPTKDNVLGQNVKAITRLGPSIYPIIFAAVAGKSLKTLARYQAERGMKLGVLETLLGSQTFWGTLETQLLLRQFTVFGAHLFLLWCLSPLGGQSSLRILETSTNSQVRAGKPVLYLPTGGMNAQNVDDSMLFTSDAATPLAVVNALFSANLLAPIVLKSSHQDPWGNIKVPRLATMEGLGKLPGEWITVPDLNSADNYTSLAGLPIAGLVMRPGTSQDFIFDYGYLDLSCSSPSAYQDGMLGLVWSSNSESLYYDNDTKTTTSFFLDTNTPLSEYRREGLFQDQDATTIANESQQTPRNILFGSLNQNSMTRVRNCTVKSVYIEAKAQCVVQGCKVMSIRPSVKYARRNPNMTPLDLTPVYYDFMKYLPLATGSVHDGDTSAAEYYIRRAQMPFGLLATNSPEMDTVPNDLFAIGLGQLMNTFLLLSLAPLAYTGNLPDSSDGIWKPTNTSVSLNNYVTYDPNIPFGPPCYSNTTITMTTDTYKCNYTWFIILMASSCTLLVLGSAGAILSHFCHAPDMMGYVSSFTYNNPYMSTPSGGGSLSAIERARLLKDIEVKIGDARNGDEIGHVVFASIDRAESIGDLNLKKRYR